MKWVPVRAREALTSSFYTVFCTDFESDIHSGWKCVFCRFKRVQKFAKNRQKIAIENYSHFWAWSENRQKIAIENSSHFWDQSSNQKNKLWY